MRVLRATATVGLIQSVSSGANATPPAAKEMVDRPQIEGCGPSACA